MIIPMHNIICKCGNLLIIHSMHDSEDDAFIKLICTRCGNTHKSYDYQHIVRSINKVLLQMNGTDPDTLIPVLYRCALCNKEYYNRPGCLSWNSHLFECSCGHLNQYNMCEVYHEFEVQNERCNIKT